MEGPALSVARIRKFAPGDVQGVLEVQSLSPEAGQWRANDYERASGGEIDVRVAENDGEIVGFLVARHLGQETEILNLAVRPSARQRGVATALLGEALTVSRTGHAGRVILEVRASNAVAIKFYQRHGFRIVGRRPGYYDAPPDDALLLDLRL